MTRSHSVDAAYAHTNLTLFSVILGIVESSDLCGPAAQRQGARIAAICKSAMQRQLRAYDEALEKGAFRVGS